VSAWRGVAPAKDLGPVQAGALDQAGDVGERAHVFLGRRRVHHDQAGAVVGVQPQVTPKARIGRRRTQRFGPQAVLRGQWRQPAFEGVLAFGVGPGDGGRRGCGAHG
jgi:hypothetical protein